MSYELPRAHAPWNRIDADLPQILALGLSAEIAFKGPDFDQLDRSQLTHIARSLQSAAQRPTVHAPFFDLNPGALDPLVRQVTRIRLEQALEAAGQLGAEVMVIHPGYDRWRYPGLGQVWVEYAAEFLQPLVQRAAALDCVLALENIYEQTTDTLVQLVDTVDAPGFGHCFDIGHWHLFGTEALSDWLARIAPRLIHLHLHDNHGEADEHLPVNSANIDFDGFFAQLGTYPCRPSITLEAHSFADLTTSLANVRPYLKHTG